MIFGARTRIAFLWGCVFASVGYGGDIVGNVSVEGMKSAGSIVVYVDGPSVPSLDAAGAHVAVHQKSMTFIPHVLPIKQGTTVDFWNDDVVKHGVSWPAVGDNKKLAHYLGIWPQGEMRSFTFNDVGVVPLLCALHPEMSAFIVVVPTPYFAVTDEEGKFTIRDVPSGEYTLKIWSESGEPLMQSIHVTDEPAPVNFTVKRASRR